MTRINFENGVSVNFNGTPTQQDIEEIATKLGINKPMDKQDGWVKSLAKSAIKPFAEIGTSAYNVAAATGNLLTGDQKGAEQALSSSRNLPFLGETKPAFTGQESTGEAAKKMVGYGAEIASWYGGGAGAKQAVQQGLKGVIKQGAKTGAKYGAISTAMMSGGQPLQEGGTWGEAATGAALGAAGGAVLGAGVGALAPVAMKGVKGALRPIEEKLAEKAIKTSDKIDEYVGKVIQGKTKDIGKARKAIQQLDIDGVKTYDELGDVVNNEIETIANKQDELLLQNPTQYKLDQLVSKTKVGEEEVARNYVTEAINNLKELYQVTADDVALKNITNLENKMNQAGLSAYEVNKIARRYGTEFGDKAFSKTTKEPLTSVNAVRYENIRKGVKNAARNLMPDDASKELDAQLTNLFSLKKNINKMVEAVNTLSQKTTKRKPLEKAGAMVGQLADIATFGLVRGFLTKMFPSNVGLKTMNSLDLDRALAKFLSQIKNLSAKEATLKIPPTGIGRKLTEETKQSMRQFIAKPAAGLSIEDVSKDNVLLLNYIRSHNAYNNIDSLSKVSSGDINIFSKNLQKEIKKSGLDDVKRQIRNKLTYDRVDEINSSRSLTPKPKERSFKQGEIPTTKLEAEARKYKSAEEFVRNEFDSAFKRGELSRSKHIFKPNVWEIELSDIYKPEIRPSQPSKVEFFSKQEGSPPIKLLFNPGKDGTNFTVLDGRGRLETLEKQGIGKVKAVITDYDPYNGKTYEGADEYLKPKPQLTDIWNKAQGTKTAPVGALETKPTRTLSEADLVKTEPVINTKREIPLTDIHGTKRTIPSGEALTPYELKGNKVLLKDGEEYIVSKNQYQNIKGQSVKAEAKEFAPELKGTEETVKGDFIPNKNAPYPRNTVTKFSQYQLPGGKNYKEVLIKAPNKIEELPQGYKIEKKTGVDLIGGDTLYRITNEKGQFVAQGFSKQEAIEQFVEKKPLFKSSHWDEPNVISHLRLNERTYKGKKVTFMEELQSDWARSLREQEKLSKPQEGTYRPFAAPSHSLLKNWQELSVKRALKEAVDNNADYLAWTTGEQQAARYNLSQEIDNIKWLTAEGEKTLSIQPKNQGVKWNVTVDNNGKILRGGERGWKGKQLNEVIGKGVSEKILAEPKGNLSGEGLNIGGEWAKNLYDKQVKNIVEDLTGGKVEVIDMGLVDKTEKKWISDIGGKQNVQLTPKNIKIGMKISPFGGDVVEGDYIITEILGDGKFKAVPKNSVHYSSELKDIHKDKWTNLEKNYGKVGDKRYLKEMVETFDISTKKSAGQQAIKITPEIRAKVLGEAPKLKQPSGVSPFRTLEPTTKERAL